MTTMPMWAHTVEMHMRDTPDRVLRIKMKDYDGHHKHEGWYEGVPVRLLRTDGDGHWIVLETDDGDEVELHDSGIDSMASTPRPGIDYDHGVPYWPMQLHRADDGATQS